MAAVEREPGSLVLEGALARWVSERAEVEQRSEADVVAEALAVRWGRQLGDAYGALWVASPTMGEREAEELVKAEVYQPRQERRRQAS
ncbi:MAG: hypothetical protein ACR2G7_06835 [Acidimicrobiales bacterium]